MKHISNDNIGFARSAAWITVLVGATTLSSFVFACATPFAALAALAAITMRRREAFALLLTAWAANQLIGYVFLHYPQTTGSFAWGLMIGAARVGGCRSGDGGAHALAASAIRPKLFSLSSRRLWLMKRCSMPRRLWHPIRAGFSPEIVGYVFEVNALAFVGLLILQAIGRALGLALPAARATG